MDQCTASKGNEKVQPSLYGTTWFLGPIAFIFSEPYVLICMVDEKKSENEIIVVAATSK